MLQEPPHNTCHPDVLAYPGDSRTKAAYPSHQEIDLYASLRCLVQKLNHALVHEGVQLEDQMAMLAAALMLDFPLHQAFKPLPQVDGGNQQFPVVRLCGVTGKIVEKVRTISPNLFVAREHPNIGVKLRGNTVVVARRQVDIAPDSVSFLAHHKSGLGMDLQALQSVHDMYAFVFQRSRPLNIALFIESGF